MRLAMTAMLMTGLAGGLTVGGATAAQAQDLRLTTLETLAGDVVSSDRLNIQDMGGLPGERSIALARQFRLRVTGLTTSPTTTAAPLRIRGRFATAMVDFFPLGVSSGFHLSAGTRFHVRRDFYKESANATRDLMFAPRGGGGGLRSDRFKKFTPTATFGYLGDVLPNLSFGIEAGARMGRAFMGGPRIGRLGAGFGRNAPGRMGGGRDQINPMLNVMMGFRF